MKHLHYFDDSSGNKCESFAIELNAERMWMIPMCFNWGAVFWIAGDWRNKFDSFLIASKTPVVGFNRGHSATFSWRSPDFSRGLLELSNCGCLSRVILNTMVEVRYLRRHFSTLQVY